MGIKAPWALDRAGIGITTMFSTRSKSDDQEDVRTTQQTTQSVLALRAVLERKNRRPPSHPKRGKRRMQLMHQKTSKDNLLPWGSRDAEELSDAQVHIQSR